MHIRKSRNWLILGQVLLYSRSDQSEIETSNVPTRGHCESGPKLVRKISIRHFLRNIEKNFQVVTPMGPEPHHFFFLLKYLNKYGC